MTVFQRVPPTWKAERQPHHPLRLLIEDDDPVLAISDFDSYREAGLDVALCRGPGSGPCPLLAGGPCSLVESADVVLHHLAPATGVAEAMRALPSPPRVVTVGGPGADLSPRAPIESRIRAVFGHRP